MDIHFKYKTKAIVPLLVALLYSCYNKQESKGINVNEDTKKEVVFYNSFFNYRIPQNYSGKVLLINENTCSTNKELVVQRLKSIRTGSILIVCVSSLNLKHDPFLKHCISLSREKHLHVVKDEKFEIARLYTILPYSKILKFKAGVMVSATYFTATNYDSI
jgi:hypothetical protein